MRRKRICFFIIFVISLLGIADYGISENKKETLLIVATDYPPYEFEHPENGLRGFDVEVTEEAFRRVGYKVRFEFYPWTRAVQMSNEGEAAGIISCARLPEREKFMLISDPISYMTDILVVRKDYDGPVLSRLEDIKQLKLDAGVLAGEGERGALERKGIPFDESPTYEVIMKKLAEGRIDVYSWTLENALYSIRKHNMQGQFKWFFKTHFETNEFHLGISKKWSDAENILKQFNKGLKEIRKDGTYEAIHKKYQ